MGHASMMSTLAKLKEACQDGINHYEDYEAAEALLEKARKKNGFVMSEQLDLLDAKAGEDNTLSEERALFTNLVEKIAESMGLLMMLCRLKQALRRRYRARYLRLNVWLMLGSRSILIMRLMRYHVRWLNYQKQALN